MMIRNDIFKISLFIVTYIIAPHIGLKFSDT